jgi:peptide chain release factor 1
VTCQDEKSQHKNKAKALRVLKARLVEKAREEAEAARAEQRRTMVRTGDRSEKIRTYNFPQNRVTDHRVGLTVHALEEILNGNLDRVLDPLIEHDIRDRLKQQTTNEA